MQTQGKEMAWQLLIRTVESCDVEVCYLNSPAIGITSERVSFTYFYILQFILLSSFWPILNSLPNSSGFLLVL